MSGMIINLGNISKSIVELSGISRTASSIASIPLRSTINGSFSAVSGLDQLGNYHGVVLMGGPGSARSVLESYAEQVEWLKNALQASAHALHEQNEAFARSLDRAEEGNLGNVGGAAFPPRPVPRYEPFVFPAPVVGPAGSIHQLAAAFGATQIGQAQQAAALWGKMAAGIGSVAAGLVAVAADLRVHNYGDVVDSAIKHVVEVADTGKAFARNAALMVSSTMNLAPVQQQGSQLVSAMQSAINAMPEPEEKQAAEAAFLQAFPAAYTPMLLPGVPVVRSLTDPSFSLSLGSLIPTGMGPTAGKGHKHDAAGLRPAGERELHRIIQAARRVGEGGKETFAEVLARTPTVGETSSEAVGTVSAAANTAEAAMSPVSSVPGGASVGHAGAGTAAANPSGVSEVVSPVAMGRPGMGAIGAMEAGPASRSGDVAQSQGGAVARDRAGMAPVTQLKPHDVSTSAASWAGPAALGGLGSPGVARGGTPPFLGAHPAAMLSGAGSGFGASTLGTHHAGGIAPAGMTPVGVAQGSSAAPGTRLGTGGASAVGGAAARSQTFMGPMPGAAGGGQAGRGKKIKTVTSAVEENENVRALLGDRPPVVPGVIGHWARG
ncbi:hypothetical protein H7347_00685 [Corynebacterium sp. zg-331]|uniref:hypothetical protein n=1 Tax=unclassified Corynebacterium TaxID=2624378 RepID=UPI00128AE053|nr:MULTISPECIES: hypothetical protein [unclassified Corynebacterium]MBC3185109.1 hypothetical protein [Corynebacterium sp. zg-331]MPV51607.1 hypothetical protein [Corynebacterium sp. zg331]